MSFPVFPDSSVAEHEAGFIESRDGVRLFWQLFVPRRLAVRPATVAVVHGAGDHSGRYPALVFALVSAGYAVALVDYRGHGRSDGVRWHVDRFSQYLDDIDAFVERIDRNRSGTDLFVVAHSNGGLIAALWAVARKPRVAGFVFSSPFFELAARLPVAKRLGVRLLGSVAPRLHLSAGLEISQLTSDEEMQRWTAGDPLYLRATTPRWIVETGWAQQELRRRAFELRTPFLLLAGGADGIAEIKAARVFYEKAGSTDKQFELYEGFRHELFNEVERERPIRTAIAWITARAGKQESR